MDEIRSDPNDPVGRLEPPGAHGEATTAEGAAETAALALENSSGSGGAATVRATAELLVCLCIGVLVFRTFGAEAYVVPTGSMAPTLLGRHREVVCGNCGILFVVGIGEQGESGPSLCPNCGRRPVEGADSIACGGDRVLVQKFLYEFRRPRRWEVAVFQFPGDPSQAYVKRVVGLPGESIRIQEGDVYADGRIARKTLDDVRAMRILVHDGRFVPADSDRAPRWLYRRGAGPPESSGVGAGWFRSAEGGFVHPSTARAAPDADDWLIYRHWEPTRERYTAIHDFYAYNGADLRADHAVADVSIEARIAAEPDVESIVLALGSGRGRVRLRLPIGSDDPIRLMRAGRSIAVRPADSARTRCQSLIRDSGAPALLEAAVVDRRILAAIDGELLFDPIDYEEEENEAGAADSRDRDGGSTDRGGGGFASGDGGAGLFSLGVRGGGLSVAELRVYRDVYYTSSLVQTPRRAFGVLEPYRLGVDEYFVLGDNSPVSNDSRFWPTSPVVPGSMFLGKPFLVHLPGQVVPLEVFGRSVYWVPDPRRIRYIR